MMDCQTVRQLWEHRGWPENSSVGESTAAAHLDRCASCRRWVERQQRDEEQLRQAIHRVEVPEGLLDRLLTYLDCQLESPAGEPPLVVGLAVADHQVIEATTTPLSVDQTTSLQPSRSAVERSADPRSRRWSLVTALSVLVAIGGLVWWNSPARGPRPIAFETALSIVEGMFADPGRAESAWETLPAWDVLQGSLPLAPLDSLSRRLSRFDPRGIDLDGQPGPEAVAFRFTAGAVQGVIVVLPASTTALAPATTATSSQQVLVWAAPQGDQSYVCFIHAGRADDLRDLLRSA